MHPLLLRHFMLLMLLAAPSPTQARMDLPPQGAARVPVMRGIQGGCQSKDVPISRCRNQPGTGDNQQPPIIGRPPPIFHPVPIVHPSTGSNLVLTGTPVGRGQSGSPVGPVAIILALVGAVALTWRLRGRIQRTSPRPQTRLVVVPDFGQQSCRFVANSTNVREPPVTVLRSRDLKSVLSPSPSMTGV